jgi:Flp pilus assembly protein TadG
VKELSEHVRRFKTNQKGTALVLVALSIVALIGFTALAVDGGYLYFRHTRLQDISDSAAIAAGIEIVEGQNKKEKDAFNAAIDYVKRHGLETANEDKKTYTAEIKWGTERGHITVSFPGENLSQIMVQISVEANTFYARVLGTSSTPVGVTSVVQIGQASQQQGNLIPVAVFERDYERNLMYKLTLQPGDGSMGNYGFLAFEEIDKLKFRDYLIDGYPGTLTVGETVDTNPGVQPGQVDDINIRVERCTHGCTFDNLTEPCPRIVIVPIVDEEEFFKDGGKHPVHIVGFAKFFIESYVKKDDDGNGKVLNGYFLEQLVPSEISEGDDQFTTQSVNLIR